MIASTVTPKRVEWLWRPWVPRGKLTLVAGAPGQGKSLFTSWLAAQVTTGPAARAAIVMSAEDDPADTLRPRLEAAGANLDRCWLEPAVELDAAHLSAVCDQLGDVGVITIDPVTAYFGGKTDTWKNADVRKALEPIRQLAAARGLAVVLVQHLNRRDGADPLARIADSQGIAQLCRSVCVWGPDPADPEGDQGTHKVLTRGKNNLSRDTDAATFSIVERRVTDEITAPALHRGANRNIAAQDVVADHETRSAQDEAEAWLRSLLANGPVAAKDGQRQARDNGISDSTLKRARRAIPVIAEQDRADGLIGGWIWRLPTNTPDPLDLLDPVDPLDPKEVKEVKKINNSKGKTRPVEDADVDRAEDLLLRFPEARA